ncbi:DUF1801 domain-containing protein [Roseibium denhamense]|uniref:YdhG-like domain-containing protein n=1 Tax=Roseibium denhamense TaxID=76305 RepID=A0ABY1NQ75_9HYPH|nr:DUF1801 domain-containing protein [Roseibium denhamense]MTI07965.1 DUF1801 domain-containing protein [Roseibium denhamense]SMP15224.1 protein of unknown function (DU1801) [Roseibium denhamense]
MIQSAETSNLWTAYPEATTQVLAQLRALIHEVAKANPAIGRLQESVKWAQLSIQPLRPKTGTPIRLDAMGPKRDHAALFVSCNTTLVGDWRDLFPDLEFGGNRSVHFQAEKPLPEAQVRAMVTMAFTYHAAKSARASRKS